jgi:hypothetical protein
VPHVSQKCFLARERWALYDRCRGSHVVARAMPTICSRCSQFKILFAATTRDNRAKAELMTKGVCEYREISIGSHHGLVDRRVKFQRRNGT